MELVNQHKMFDGQTTRTQGRRQRSTLPPQPVQDKLVPDREQAPPNSKPPTPSLDETVIYNQHEQSNNPSIEKPYDPWTKPVAHEEAINRRISHVSNKSQQQPYNATEKRAKHIRSISSIKSLPQGKPQLQQFSGYQQSTNQMFINPQLMSYPPSTATPVQGMVPPSAMMPAPHHSPMYIPTGPAFQHQTYYY